MGSWYAKFIGSHVFANLMLVAVLAAGLIAVFSIRRESNPDISLRMVSVLVPYPGADPEEIEEGITQKIGAVLDGMRGVRRYWTQSGEGFAEATVEVSDGFDVAEVRDRIGNAVESINTFPQRAERPRVTRVEDQDEVGLVFVWGDLPERQLKELGETIRVEIQALPEVSMIEPFGSRQYEITVEVSEQALRQYGLTLRDVTDAISRSSLNLSAGTLRLETQEVRIRALGRRYTGPEFESVVVKALPGGEVVTLGQIASVRDAFEEREHYTTFNGRAAVAMEISRAPGEDVLKISAALSRYIAAQQPGLPPGIHVTKAFDRARFIEGQIRMLLVNGMQGLTLVLLVLWLFLESRLAIWVAIGIPISLTGATLILWLIGGSLNQITLVGMIVVLGMIVDDAIVTGEAIYVHREKGLAPLAACVAGVREVALPVFASVSTTIVAFLPMFFLGGVMGQVVRQLPLVVNVALAVSFAECMLLFPAHLNYRSRPSRLRLPEALRWRKHASRAMDAFVERVYGPVAAWSARRRYVAVCLAAAICLLSVGLVGGGIVPITMWPPVEGDSIQAYVEFAPGTPVSVVRDALAQTNAALERVAARTKTKSGAPLLTNVFAVAPQRLDSAGRLSAELLTTAQRGIRVEDIIAELSREVGHIPGAIVQTFQGEVVGSSGDGDVSLWLQGNDYGALRAASEELKAKLAAYSGVFQVKDNFRPGKAELQVRLKPAARHLGLTLEDVSRQLYADYQGEEALTLLRGRDEVKVRVRLPRAERERISSFAAVHIHTPDGGEVPLATVAEVTEATGVSSISGINGVRGIQVSASVDRARANPTTINQEVVQNFLPGLLARHPGITWTYSPNAEDNRAMLAALSRNGLIAVLVIFVILCTSFHSYVQPLLVMLVIPFGIVGAIIGHLALGMPVSFLSLAGIIALAGVIVNNAIVLIERMNSYLAEGLPLHEAIGRAGKRRFRAVFLTSVTTVFGLGPIIVGSSLMAQIVIPMAVSMASGLAIGTVLTLAFLPAFVMILSDLRRALFRLRRGRWPSPEEVEPAARTHEGDGAASAVAASSPA
jgi:multidrug efflux pump subunit AcrB